MPPIQSCKYRAIHACATERRLCEIQSLRDSVLHHRSKFVFAVGMPVFILLLVVLVAAAGGLRSEAGTVVRIKAIRAATVLLFRAVPQTSNRDYA